jgi:hypothetical protein
MKRKEESNNEDITLKRHEAQLPMEEASKPTSQRSKQTKEGKRKKQPVNKELTMLSHGEKRTTHGGLQAVLSCGLSCCKGKDDSVALTMDGDMQAKGTNKSGEGFCNEDVTEGTVCESRSDELCVWLSEIETVVAVNKMEHAGMSLVNSTSRKVAYRDMVPCNQWRSR